MAVNKSSRGVFVFLTFPRCRSREIAIKVRGEGRRGESQKLIRRLFQFYAPRRSFRRWFYGSESNSSFSTSTIAQFTLFLPFFSVSLSFMSLPGTSIKGNYQDHQVKPFTARKLLLLFLCFTRLMFAHFFIVLFSLHHHFTLTKCNER